MKILITGCAGFIGFHTTLKYMKSKKNQIVGVDSINSYYSTKLKQDRLKNLIKFSKGNFIFYKLNICNYKKLFNSLKNHKFDLIIHLAAQAGVRYSINNPDAYIKSNINGFFNILKLTKEKRIDHLIFASSSSVYGDSKNFPLNENDSANTPLQLYAATKKSNEIISSSYSSLFKIRITALRFFTVYGPWGRPDMAIFKFTKKILNNQPIQIFNHGNHFRDFTYIDDIVNGIIKASKRKNLKKNKLKTNFEILNIGYGQPVKLMDCVKILEKNLGKTAKKKYLSFQKGDMHKTYSNNNKIVKMIKYKTSTNIEEGIKKFVMWYKKYYI